MSSTDPRVSGQLDPTLTLYWRLADLYRRQLPWHVNGGASTLLRRLPLGTEPSSPLALFDPSTSAGR
jgi:hypothetical protein